MVRLGEVLIFVVGLVEGEGEKVCAVQDVEVGASHGEVRVGVLLGVRLETCVGVCEVVHAPTGDDAVDLGGGVLLEVSVRDGSTQGVCKQYDGGVVVEVGVGQSLVEPQPGRFHAVHGKGVVEEHYGDPDVVPYDASDEVLLVLLGREALRGESLVCVLYRSIFGPTVDLENNIDVVF